MDFPYVSSEIFTNEMMNVHFRMDGQQYFSIISFIKNHQAPGAGRRREWGAVVNGCGVSVLKDGRSSGDGGGNGRMTMYIYSKDSCIYANKLYT